MALKAASAALAESTALGAFFGGNGAAFASAFAPAFLTGAEAPADIVRFAMLPMRPDKTMYRHDHVLSLATNVNLTAYRCCGSYRRNLP